MVTNKKIRYLVASVSAGDQSLPKLCCPSHKTSQSVYCSLFHLCVCISLDDDEQTDEKNQDSINENLEPFKVTKEVPKTFESHFNFPPIAQIEDLDLSDEDSF